MGTLKIQRLRTVSATDRTLTVLGLVLAISAGAASVVIGYWLLLMVAIAVVALLIRLEWSGSRGRDKGVTRVVISPNYGLIVMPTLLGTSAISLPVGIALITAVVLASFSMKSERDVRLQLTWAAMILPIASAFIVFRSNYPSTAMHVIFFVLSCIALARLVTLSESRSSAIASLIDGAGIYAIASVGLWAIGLSAVTYRTAGLDNALTGGDRVVFPLANSLAATPNMAAIYCVAVVPMLLASNRNRSLRLVALVCCAIIFALSDARVSLIGAIILVGFVVILPRVFRVMAPVLVGVSLAAPFFYASIQEWVGYGVAEASERMPWLIRPGEEASTLNQRDFIWAQSLDFYSHRIDWVRQMFGFGAYGHAESGASSSYAGRFAGLGSDDKLMTPHNSALQLLFDGGWLIALVIGLVVFVVTLIYARRAGTSPYFLGGLGAVVMLAIVSATEIASSPGHAQPTWWTLLALSLVAFSREGFRADPGLVHNTEPCSRHTRSLMVENSWSATSQSSVDTDRAGTA